MIITFLGKGFKTVKSKRATYYFEEELSKKFQLKKSNYTNMLPLIIDNFSDKEIIPIFTKEAKETQTIVLDDEFGRKYENLFNDKYFIEDTKDFASILSILNQVISQNHSYIIDLTHSFRHLPILATISLISNHISDTSRVEHIFFAKEIDPSTKATIGKYEIIDLKKYLELANLSYMLSSFNQNYTISNNIKFSNPLYQEIADELNEFSSHFLSNSLKELIDGALIDNIITNLKDLQKDKEIESFKNYIDEIIKHLSNIQKLKEKSDWEKLYELSKIMNHRGYQLNANTLLFEAVGFYCVERFSKIELFNEKLEKFKNNIQMAKKPLYIYTDYTLTNESRTIVKKLNSFNTYNTNFIDDDMREKILLFTQRVNRKDFRNFRSLIFDMEKLRNNLTHGNSGINIDDVKKEYEDLLKRVKQNCIKQDVLKN